MKKSILKLLLLFISPFFIACEKKIELSCDADKIDISNINVDRECHINGLLACKIDNIAYNGEVYADMLGDSACIIELDIFQEKRIVASIDFEFDLLHKRILYDEMIMGIAKSDSTTSLTYHPDTLQQTNKAEFIYYDANKKEINGCLQNVKFNVSKIWLNKNPKKEILLENLIFKASTTPRVKKCLRCGTM